MLFRTFFLVNFIRAEFKNSYVRYLSVILSFALAIALLISLSSFSFSFSRSMYEDSKSLLGADIAVTKIGRIDGKLLDEIRDLDYSLETVFTSMVLHNASGRSRLVQVRAQSGNYPYYGEMIIEPPHSRYVKDLDSCLIDESIKAQLQVAVGDKIQLGSREYTVRGIIKKYPGDTYGRTLIAPKVIIPLASLDQTNLLKKGSRVSQKIYIKTNDARLVQSHLSRLNEKYQLEIETTEDSQKKLGKVFEQISKYIILLSVALVSLSAVGLYSALSSFIKGKIPSILTLFCLGATKRKIFIHYLLICSLMSILSFIVALGLASGLVYLLPFVFSDFLSLSVEPIIESQEVLKCLMLVFIITLVSVYLSVTPVLSLHPSQALRDQNAPRKSMSSSLWDGMKTVLGIATLSVLCVYIFSQDLRFSFAVVGVCVVALALFYGVIFLFRKLIRKFSDRSMNFSLRYATSMLSREGSNTSVILSIGFTMLILFIISIQRSSLIAQFAQAHNDQRPNMVLFDVQTDQTEIVRGIVEPSFGKILSEAPIVTMRIEAINGKSNSSLRSDKDIPDWTLKREYRSTFRGELIEGEKLTLGELVSEIKYAPDTIVPITVDEGLANNLKLKLGDIIDFDVQGVRVKTTISGMRKINWRRIQTNFFFVFPRGVLESAPHMSAYMVSLHNLENSGPLQNALIEAVPNVSAIDLKLILDTTDELIDRIVMIIQFLGLFSLFSGLLILISSLIASRLERIRESLLLRALGARQVEIRRSQTIEFLLLSLLSLIPSFVLSVIVSYLLMTGYFDIEISFSFFSLFMQVSLLIAAILTIGLLFSRGIKNTDLIHVLRE